MSFETGAAWFSERTCVLVRTGGLGAEEIPLPLSSKQMYSLDSAENAHAVFQSLDLKPSGLMDLVTEVASLVGQAKLVGNAEPAWEGVELQGTFYAWAGPLLGLNDKAGVECPTELSQVLKQRGLSVRFGDKNRLSHHYGRGRSQVFATDRKSWRRPVVSGKQLLLVARPEDSKQ